MPQQMIAEQPFVSPPFKNKGKELEGLYPSKYLPALFCPIFPILTFVSEFELFHSDYHLGCSSISKRRGIFSFLMYRALFAMYRKNSGN